MGEVSVRKASASDVSVLQRALYLAAMWRGERDDSSPERVLAHEYLVIYHHGWSRHGDIGVVAEVDGEPIGAAYGRLFSEEEHGHGYIDEHTPEIAIGVEYAFRGRGVGSQLLAALGEAYRRAGVTTLSLSVEKDNRAAGLYRRHGYDVTIEDDTAFVMVKGL